MGGNVSKSNPPFETASEFVSRTLLLCLAWLGSITLAQVQALVGILSGLMLAGYTGYKWWALHKWRMEQKASGNTVPPTEPGGL